ncbi:outer membrane protein [Luteibacter rhizovicinus]|uniref:Outer membrane protein n=1 Tax=Luteibacter rhizovicinus TaxID=242606 RepID=A0A4R3YJ40_9GAMM|nr:MipA/OmpV family protein [Luteibacter rhizovicinus]TCV92705.1 outer membrane protein [Luteibacter rhizovicinus]
MSIASLRLASLSAALACTAFCSSALAQSAPQQSPTWTLGLGAVWSPSPYRSYNNKAWPLPMVNYDGKSFYAHGAIFGYRLFKTDSDEFSITASPLGNRFRHDDTDDARLRQLSNRDISGMVGVAWRHQAVWGAVQASAQKEFTGHGGGSAFDLNYSYPIIRGNLTLVPTGGVTYSNGALNNYYYGIGTSEALRSGLPAYHAGGGSSPYLGMAAIYKLSHSWLATGGLRYTRLPTSVKDSPMVDADHTVSYFVALSYIF